MKTDQQLRDDIMAELAWDPSIDAATVGVIVNKGVVTLTGHLNSYAQKHGVERIVERVAGVKAIAVETDVKLPDSSKRTDTDIAAAAEHALSWNAMVPKDRLKVRVEHGAVTLSGDVDWSFQRSHAGRAVRALTGVVEVFNRIAVKSGPAPADLHRRIASAITRQAMREVDRIKADVQGGTVTLRGPVHSWAERRAAKGAVWAAPGVTAVIDEMVVAD